MIKLKGMYTNKEYGFWTWLGAFILFLIALGLMAIGYILFIKFTKFAWYL